ncbi:MAG: hypothetical protein ACI865_002960 [Flavobacteriaceae bacterium]
MSESKPHELEQLANMRMPFGKYKGKFLIHIPEPYLIWYRSKGFPPGKLGRQLELILEIKINGLESLIYPLMRK